MSEIKATENFYDYGMSIVRACPQLYAVKCLGAGFVGVTKFRQISGGGVNGHGQNLVKSQGQILHGLGQGLRLKIGGWESKSLTPVAGGSIESICSQHPLAFLGKAISV